MAQQLFGYKLTASDGSESKWEFINSGDQRFSIIIKMKNGALLAFEGFDYEIGRWAYNRELAVHECTFDFDPVAMAFTKEA